MLTPDDTLQDRYRIVRRLGHGGMGAVYEAIDRRVKSTVAIKETFALTEQGRRAFRHEAQRLANLEHEVFPKVFDHFEEGEGLYLVMQLVRGEDLAERLKERMTFHEGPFSPQKVLEWADQLLDALEMLHEYRPPIVHRDIKPSNLKLTQRGKIFLLDFGIAKGVAGLMSGTDGSIKAASPNFSPLEQVLKIDEPSTETLSSISENLVEKVLRKGTTPSSDLYALGATLYCLMTGKLPTDSRLRAMAVWTGRSDPLQPANKVNSQVTEAVSNILMQAMGVEPDSRIVDAATMRRSLREAVHRPGYIALGTSLPRELDQWSKEEAKRRVNAETEIQPPEEEERPWSGEATFQRNAEPQRETETQETIRLAIDEGGRLDVDERKSEAKVTQQQTDSVHQSTEPARRKGSLTSPQVESGRPAETEHIGEEIYTEKVENEARAQRLVTAEAEALQTSKDGRSTQPLGLLLETIPEEEHIAETQESTAPSQLTVETISYRSPVERIDPPWSESGAPTNRKFRAALIGVMGVAALIVLVLAIGKYRGSIVPGGRVPTNSLEEVAAPSPTESVTSPPNMVYVPGGEFTMGRDGDLIGYESPAHKVNISPFYIDVYEVTREDYQKCVDEKKCQPPSIWRSGKFPEGTAKLPVTGVTWDEANAYASWVGKRLPTEGEWEYVARGGQKQFRYPWGNDWQAGLANANSTFEGLTEVGRYRGASPFGVIDMVGNAWEWTASPFKAYGNNEIPEITEAMKRFKNLKVIRGCMYKCSKDQATTTYRRALPANGYIDYSNTGFRCAKDASK